MEAPIQRATYFDASGEKEEEKKFQFWKDP